jgi:hypothetical protein
MWSAYPAIRGPVSFFGIRHADVPGLRFSTVTRPARTPYRLCEVAGFFDAGPTGDVCAAPDSLLASPGDRVGMGRVAEAVCVLPDEPEVPPLHPAVIAIGASSATINQPTRFRGTRIFPA